jgi:hypothetical protein
MTDEFYVRLGLPPVPNGTEQKKNAASARDRKFEGDKIVDRLTETGSKYPFTGHELSCIISDRTAKRVVRDWMERKHQEIWKSTP